MDTTLITERITEEFTSMLRAGLQDQKVRMLDMALKYFRQKEKEYQEGDGEVSGTALLYELIGRENLELYLSMKPAVENFRAPYEINVTGE